jgi:polyribonucleotide 5'-hydroxyl-kinase
VRLGRTPTFVDLDIGQGQITVPGAMAAVALDSSTLSVEEGFSLAAPLAFFYGHTSQSENPELFRALVTRLAECVQQRLSNDKDAAAAGLIVNTCGWVEGLGLELLRHCIRALAIDIVLVVGVRCVTCLHVYRVSCECHSCIATMSQL